MLSSHTTNLFPAHFYMARRRRSANRATPASVIKAREGSGTELARRKPTLALMAAYIDLNPVRAGIVADPKDYRWCGYAETVAGIKMAKEGIKVAVEARRQRAVSVNAAPDEYRGLLFTWGEERGAKADGTPMKRGFDRKRAAKELARGAKLSAATLLRCRVRYFTAGAVIGGRAFVDGVFSALRDRFGATREDGARRFRGLDAGAEMFALRDLRRDLFA